MVKRKAQLDSLVSNNPGYTGILGISGNNGVPMDMERRQQMNLMIILSQASDDGVPWIGYLVILAMFVLAWLWHKYLKPHK